MKNLPKHIFSFIPDGHNPAPLTETVNGETKTIAFCTSAKMAKELILRLQLLSSLQYELEYILESNLTSDQIHEHIKNRLGNPPDFYKEPISK